MNSANSQIAGVPDLDGEAAIPRKQHRYMADAAIYAWHAMRKSVEDAAIGDADIRDPRTALIVGSGVGSPFSSPRSRDNVQVSRD